MAWKQLNQTSLADTLIVEHQAVKALDDVNQLIEWNRIESKLSHIHNKRRGEQAWPPLMMFKALLLQSWYNLSDPGLEQQLARDLLFRRFVGLRISTSVPDHSTLWRFRQLLSSSGLLDTLLQAINEQLSSKGLLIEQGQVSIIDASVIEAKQNRPNKNKQGQSTQDPEAAYNVKRGSDGKRKATYGYKAHINVEEDGFVKAYQFTPGNVHDSQVFESLLDEKTRSVYADSAYKSQAHDAYLRRRGIQNKLSHRAYRNRPLNRDQKRLNRIHSGVRSTVERIFGVLKLHYGMGKARYLGLTRNRVRLGLMCLAYNLKRGVNIQREMCKMAG